MSFWRKRQIADKVNKDNLVDIPANPYVAVDEAPKVSEKPVYQVGKTEDNRVTLRLGSDYAYTTLTMNNQAVDGLIKLLEAAKEPEGDDHNVVDDYI